MPFGVFPLMRKKRPLVIDEQRKTQHTDRGLEFCFRLFFFIDVQELLRIDRVLFF